MGFSYKSLLIIEVNKQKLYEIKENLLGQTIKCRHKSILCLKFVISVNIA